MNRELKQPNSSFLGQTLPRTLYTAEQVRKLDRLAIETIPIDGFELMKKAGRSAFRMLLRNWPEASSLSIFCGGGNNGGDGLIIAGLAAQQGMSVELILLTDTSVFKGEAAAAWDWLQQFNRLPALHIRRLEDEVAMQGELIVDCLLGTGLTGDVRGNYVRAIDAINRSVQPVLAVDIPSGLCSDTGRVLGRAVYAQRTMTFIGVKQGLLTGEGPACVGELEFNALDVPESVYKKVQPSCLRAGWDELENTLPKRKKTAHKGAYGRVLVVGGDHGMGGAALMAAEAVCRVGAGLVSVATRAEHVSAYITRCPELMVHGVDDVHTIETMVKKADVIVIGPGLGQSEWGHLLLACALEANKPMVIDADGLNRLAHLNPEPRTNWILTPHPGEAARMLNTTIEKVEQNRFQAVLDLQQQYGGTIILKGAGSLIATASEYPHVWLADTGNPGMASGGMGDVLSGVLGGLLAQEGIDRTMVAPTGVALHGEAGNLARSAVGEYSLLATDVLKAIPQLLKTVK